MDRQKLASTIDATIRFFIYLLIFWLPYSPAVVESSVIMSLLLWIVKRIILFSWKENLRSGCLQCVFAFLKGFQPARSFLNPQIYLFLLMCVFSIFSTAFFSHAVYGFLTKTIEWFVVYFLIIEVFNNKRHIQIAVAVLLFTAFSTSLDGIVQYHLTGKDFFFGYELNGGGATASFKHYNNLGSYLTFIVPLAFALTVSARDLKRLVFRGGILIAAAWSLVITFSRGAWLGVILGLLLMMFLQSRKKFLIFMGLLVAGSALFYVLTSGSTKETFRLDKYQVQETAIGRAELWKEVVPMIKEKPFFGHGPNTFMMLFQAYRANQSELPTYAHNCYFQLASEFGLMGLGAFLLIIFSLCFKVYSAITCVSYDQSYLKTLASGVLAGVLAYLTHSFFDTNLYSLKLSIHFWVMVGLLVVIERLLHYAPKTKS